MLKITVCIGSSCHIKGSRQVVEQLQYLIAENRVGEKVELGGIFCIDAPFDDLGLYIKGGQLLCLGFLFDHYLFL